jgi:diguanylate cyclase (GGDEF)-like protein
VPLKNLPTSEEKSQALRINRSKAAFATSLALLAWLCLGFQLGLVNGIAVAVSAAWIFGYAIIVFWLQLTNRNLKFNDPSLTQPLVLAAIACVLGNTIFLDAVSSAVAFIWLLTAVGFSTLHSKPSAMKQMAYWTAIAMCICGYLQYHLQPGRSIAIMLWQGSAFLGAILTVSIFGIWANKIKTKNRQKQLLADLTISSMTDAVLNLDSDGRIVSANPAAEKLFDLQRSVITQQLVPELLNRILVSQPDKQADWLVQNLRERSRHAIRGREQTRTLAIKTLKVTFEVNKTLERYKSKRRLEATLGPVKDEYGKNAGLLLVLKDVTEQFNLLKQLNFDSTHDSMTGLLNRRGFEAKLDELDVLINASPRVSKTTIAMLDLDNLKIVNDTCGHLAGDRLIEQASDAIRRATRQTDLVARYGGDEFALIFPDTSAIKAREICERIILAIKELGFQWEGKLFKTGASVGCVNITKGNFPREQWLSKADSALYLAKELGKGRVQFHDLDDAQISDKSAALDWAWRINDAIEKNQFQLYAQRIVSTDPECEDHFEILIRLQTSDGKIVPPISFLPAAERFQLMPSIDRWVIENSFKALNHFHQTHGKFPKAAINLSAQSLMDVGFLDFVVSKISSHNLPADRLCFELTETVAVTNLEGARQFIEQIRLLGCEFQLDDVGAGFNAFSYLSDLTFDAIKIDGHYIKGIATNDANRGIVESLVRAADSIGLQTIAEMIEDQATAQTLISMGINHLQGYYFHKPEPIVSAFASKPLDVSAMIKSTAVDSNCPAL